MPSNGSSKYRDPLDETVRQAYEEVLNEPLPNRFVDLLKKLRQGELPDEEPPSGDQG